MTRTCALLSLIALLWIAAPAAAATKVDYGPISHKGLKKLGGVSSKSTKLTLQLGLVANQSGLQKAVKAASNPASSSYGKYPSLSTLQSKYGASSSKRKGVVNAFKKQSVKATVDVTHLRATRDRVDRQGAEAVRHEVGGLQGEVGRARRAARQHAEAPKGIKGNVDTVAGTRLQLTKGSASAVRRRHADPHRLAGPRLHAGQLSRAAVSGNGLFPNQILTAYGIAPLQAAGLQGQGVRLAIVGRGADAGVGRQRVPLVLRDAGDVAEDPQRRRRSSRSSRARSTRWSPRWWRRSCRASICGSTR